MAHAYTFTYMHAYSLYIQQTYQLIHFHIHTYTFTNKHDLFVCFISLGQFIHELCKK